MDEELISKKELLELTGISYGQLYRWKRKGLIPEDWFIRKSTYTGQETFFSAQPDADPRRAHTEYEGETRRSTTWPTYFRRSRGHPRPPTADDLMARGIVSADVMRLFMDGRDNSPLRFDDALHAYLFGQVLVSGELSLDEARLMLDTLRTAAIKFGAAPAKVLLTRKLGVFACVALSATGEVCPDRDTRLVRAFNLKAAAEELKLKLV